MYAAGAFTYEKLTTEARGYYPLEAVLTLAARRVRADLRRRAISARRRRGASTWAGPIRTAASTMTGCRRRSRRACRARRRCRSAAISCSSRRSSCASTPCSSSATGCRWRRSRRRRRGRAVGRRAHRRMFWRRRSASAVCRVGRRWRPRSRPTTCTTRSAAGFRFATIIGTLRADVGVRLNRPRLPRAGRDAQPRSNTRRVSPLHRGGF